PPQTPAIVSFHSAPPSSVPFGLSSVPLGPSSVPFGPSSVPFGLSSVPFGLSSVPQSLKPGKVVVNFSRSLSMFEEMMITLYKTDDDASIRYYAMHDRQPLLTAPFALTVVWWPANGRGREKIYGFDSAASMDKKLRQLFSRKIREGYVVLYRFEREHCSIPDKAVQALL
ncbi:MAG: WGR domain-containing protein, partial [Spirochaetales bacterium]|nr:WGR domain-containing protein [Spirochaetales bacterium]